MRRRPFTVYISNNIIIVFRADFGNYGFLRPVRGRASDLQ